MVRVNFTCYPDKVRTGSKTQTIRPPRDDINVGDFLQIWWNRRGLIAGRYCEPCARYCVFELATPEHYFKSHEGVQQHYVALPQKLGEGVCTEKFKIWMGASAPLRPGDLESSFWIEKNGKPMALAAARQLIARDGFPDSKSFFAFFDFHYGIHEKPVEFEVIRWD
ncbi:hypothetical protein HY994_04080 [Candidatus Micrarchaeota archaeon]|nr:hypothetical protein [Candidatus Micrarchaeota archaeon]